MEHFESVMKPGYPANDNKNNTKIVILVPTPHSTIAEDWLSVCHNHDPSGLALDLLGSASLRVVDLAASLATLVRPGEVRNGDEEERVAAVGNTGKSIVPGGECGEDTKSTTSSDASNVGASSIMLEVTDTQHEEGEIKSEEEEEKGNGRTKCADEEEEGEDKPALGLG